MRDFNNEKRFAEVIRYLGLTATGLITFAISKTLFEANVNTVFKLGLGVSSYLSLYLTGKFFYNYKARERSIAMVLHDWQPLYQDKYTCYPEDDPDWFAKISKDDIDHYRYGYNPTIRLALAKLIYPIGIMLITSNICYYNVPLIANRYEIAIATNIILVAIACAAGYKYRNTEITFKKHIIEDYLSTNESRARSKFCKDNNNSSSKWMVF